MLAKQPAAGASGSAGKTFTIAVIPKGTTHEFWKSIHAGAIQATQELTAGGDTVRIIWKGPLREDDREQQVQVVEGFTSPGRLRASCSRRSTVARSCARSRRRRRAGVPTVIIDSGSSPTRS